MAVSDLLIDAEEKNKKQQANKRVSVASLVWMFVTVLEDNLTSICKTRAASIERGGKNILKSEHNKSFTFPESRQCNKDVLSSVATASKSMKNSEPCWAHAAEIKNCRVYQRQPKTEATDDKMSGFTAFDDASGNSPASSICIPSPCFTLRCAENRRSIISSEQQPLESAQK